MLPVNVALQLVLQHATRRPAEAVAVTAQALDLILAEDVASDLDMPPYDKSLVDGYAVRSGDLALPGQSAADGGAAGLAVTNQLLRVVEEVPAGRVPTMAVKSGQTARIMTGAMLPRGADAVVMHENTQPIGANKSICVLEHSVKPWQNVMPRGREMRQGEIVLTSGNVIRPQELGLLAAVGRFIVEVYRRPTVNILSTGDELVEPSLEPGIGQIRNSNATLLAAQVTRAGGVPHYLGIARDTVESHRLFVAEGLRCDVLLLTGGVSAGKLDLVPAVLQELGVQSIFHKVAMKPGKPLFFGKKDDTLVFGLPGNPVSALVGFELFVRPALNQMLGRAEVEPKTIAARLQSDIDHHGERQTYQPARLEASPDGWRVTPVAWFGSPDLRAITRANAFAVLPPGDRHYAAGDLVTVLAPE